MMKLSKAALAFTAISACISLVLPNIAQAKRMGGGTSIGKSSSGLKRQSSQSSYSSNNNASRTYAQPAPQPRPMPAPVAPVVQTAPSSGGSKLGAFAAGAATGVAGAMIVNSISKSNQQPVQNSGGYSNGGGGGGNYSSDAPVYNNSGGNYSGGGVAPSAPASSGIGGFLMLALMAGGGWFLWRKYQASKQASAGQVTDVTPVSYSSNNDATYYNAPDVGSSSSYQPAQISSEVASLNAPANFDEAAFLSVAKQHYTRLQQAWDTGNVSEIQRFTTPDMFSELKKQIDARQGVDKTDVMSLDAKMVGLGEDEPGEYMASVEFSGTIREDTFGGAKPFREIWNMTRPTTGNGGWMLAGIEQPDEPTMH